MPKWQTLNAYDQLVQDAQTIGQCFVAMIMKGNRTLEEREQVRDALLNGVLQHPIVRQVVMDADYTVEDYVITERRQSR